MAAELMRLGLLDDHDLNKLLTKLLNNNEFSSVTCELLTKIIEAKEAVNKTSLSFSEDDQLHDTYLKLLQECLLPQLQRILRSFSVCAQKNHILPSYTDETDKNKTNLFSVDLLRKDHNLNAQLQQEHEGTSEKTLRADEVVLVPKLSRLIVIVIKFITRSSGPQLYKGVMFHNSALIDDSLHKTIFFTLTSIFEMIAQNLPVQNTDAVGEEEHHKVRILSLIYANLLKDDWCLEHDSLHQSVRMVMDVSLKGIAISHDADITALLLMLIVKPYIDAKNEDKCEVIQKLWHIVKKLYFVDGDFVTEEGNSTGFLILCFMANHMFEGGCFSQIGNDSAFWKIIQYGLVHTNPLSRKRCQYILKRSVDYCSSSVSMTQLKSEYMYWPKSKNEELVKFWNDFFLLVESLEEKQAHVVKPVLEKLDTLMKMCCSSGQRMFHVSWTLAIFKRIFDQDNKNIKQWGLMKILRLKLPQEVLIKGVISFILLHVLPALSDYCLYSRELGQPPRTPSVVGDQLVVFLENIINSLDVVQQKDFMCSILEKIFDGRSWGGIPLFYLIRGLALMPKTAVWSYGVVKKAVANFEGCLSTQEVVLRSASQCDLVKAMFKHLVSETTFLEICDIIGHFRRKESWCRGTVLWKTIVNEVETFQETWLDRFSEIQCAINKCLFSSEIRHPHDIALGINLLHDSISLTDSISISEKKSCILALLSPIRDFLRDCPIRPYLDHKKYVWVIELLNQTLEILCDDSSDCPQRPDEFSEYLLCLGEGIGCMAQLFVKEIRRYDQPYDIEIISLHLNLFALCRNFEKLIHIPHVQYSELLQVCHAFLDQENAVKNAFGVFLLEHLLTHFYDRTSLLVKGDMMNLVLEKILFNIENVTHRRQIDGHNSAEFTSKLLLEATRSRWCCIALLVEKSLSMKEEKYLLWGKIKTVTITALPSAANAAGTMNVLHVFQVTVSLSSSIIEDGKWQELIEVMWASSMEFRKGCELYRSLVGCITDLLFHDDAMIKPEFHGFIIQMSQQMLATGEAVQGITSHMSRSLVTTLAKVQMRNNLDPKSCSDLVRDVLVPLLMFGTVYRKQYKVIQDTTDFIQECGQLYSTNSLLESDHDADSRARAIALRYLLTLSKEKPKDRHWALLVAEGIRYQYAYCTGERRDFANSQKHRYKTRLLQAFLVILPLLDKNECSEDLAWLCRGLIKDHQQPSVRYMQEWGVALITIMHPQLFPELLTHFKQGTKERVGCVGSFLAALTHVACTSEDEEVLCQSLQYTLPWCMAQHFNTRLYAQVSLRKMWHHCEAKQVNAVLKKYEPVQQCLKFVVEQGNAARNTLNMLNDFYFKVFHPIQHYTLETILHDLPCLSLLADDEWLTVDFFLGVMDTQELPVYSDLPLHNSDKVLAESLPAPWVIKAAGETSLLEEKNGSHESVNNVQRKITPWKSMVPEITASMDLPEQIETHQRRGELIVVASLIDKPPNLGGLCRTCEVFNVKEYIVPSLGILEDQIFNSLSQTAQHWVPMREVKPDGLPEYLRNLHSKGYTLVAAEQTANSIRLSDYRFPEKTVVVLGNEREGIPCELLQLLDVCVEIPQSGIIRSLNVHVSGALFIWEYTRQHLKKLT